MKSSNTFFGALLAVCLLIPASITNAQTTQMYQQMSASQRASFVSTKAKEIGRRISDGEYQFTANFETEIQASLDSYVRRLNDSKPGSANTKEVIERGQKQAPLIMSAFKAQGVSPLIGLYLPWIESAYVNISTPTPAGSVGMFQFLPQTGALFGLSPDDLLDVEKSADAAARYIAGSIKKFDQNNMKEALALLAYNRGENAVQNDLAQVLGEKSNSCSICVLTEQRDKLDKSFNNESVYYVPRFFAAAILGENPQAFGLTSPPLSSFGTGH
jgi:membrane-bound lytic murein transglycosylase D